MVLIDEYNKPIIDFLSEKEQALKNQEILRQFFSPLKDVEQNGHLHFLFITGVSKFARVSIFSDLNNLIDLTMDPLGAALLGITPEEVSTYFPEHIQHSTKELGISKKELLAGIKLWYNGYSFVGRH